MPSRLTSLELQGYKTFASRTQFVFAENVTAIVGPNGSGKSNIADSIRWVLGEQSYSLLRGKKTEDMIFAGSEQRSRAGMASATIVFDNSDGWLPIDFSEVAITRRAYRDGQNEYLLNGQRVRLKDVSELLAQSGLAERTYTIIGQGLVDAALSLKAEERRHLFEEAAGIGLHRTRREEALKRLDATRRNMERVKDILAELQPRLRSLERQARRAKEYELVMADLRLQLREWYGFHWFNSQQETSEALEQVRQKEKILHEARNNLAELDNQAVIIRQKIQSLRKQLDEWHRQSSTLHAQRESLSREMAVSGERLRALVQQQLGWSSEIERIEEQLSLHDARAAEATEQLSQLQLEMDEAQGQVAHFQESLEERQANRAGAEELLKSTRQEMLTQTSRLDQLQARLAERQDQIKRQTDNIHQVTNSLENAQAAWDAASLDLEAALQRLNQVQTERTRAEQELQDHRRSLAEVEAARNVAREQHLALQSEQARIFTRLEVLEQAEQALSGYASGVQLLIQAAQQSKLSVDLQVFSKLLEVPAEYETAIAAGLGEFLEAVLTKGDSLEPALAFLEAKSKRAAIIPVDKIFSPPARMTLDQADHAQILGVAADLVHSPTVLRPVIELLLGRVIIVRERAFAQQLVNKYAHKIPELRVITLQGEVFYASGQVLAGLESMPASLSRLRELRELRARLSSTNQKLTESEQLLASQEEQLSGLRATQEELVQAVQLCQRDEEAARAGQHSSNLSLDKAEGQVHWLHEKLTQQQGEVEQSRSETEAHQAEILDLEGRISLIRELFRQQTAALDDFPLEELLSQLAYWKTRAAVIEQAALDAHSRQMDRQAALESAKLTRQTLISRLEDGKTAQQDLEAQQESLHKMEIEVSEQVESLRVLIQPAEAELRQIEQQQNTLQTRENKARHAVSQAEHYHAQARIQHARRQEALESLRQRIEDDFGLVAFDYIDEVSGPTPLPLDGLVEQLPRVEKLPPDADENIRRQRAQLRRMGAINPEAQLEYQHVKERLEFLDEQIADLQKAEDGVREVIAELDLLIEREFRKTFDAVAQEFRQIFARLFGGGYAKLVLVDPEDMTGTGIDIEARLPGRRSQGLSLLSGGERSLTATALVFAILKVSPTPFCVLDEVDAMLDEANVGRFRELLRELSTSTQFIIVTHNRNTVQVADVIYGVTMGRDSSSQVISLKLDQVSQLVE